MKNQYRHELLNQINEDRIQRYIKENFESFDKFEEKISEALGYQYEALYDFFYGIITADYDYKILMARRCLVLCQIFTHIFSVREPDMENKGILIGDRAVARYLPDFADNKILILDDILIHGRSIKHVYKFIDEYNKNIAKLDIRVYMMSHNVKCIEKKLLDKIHPVESGYEQEWKTLSNKIVNAIYISNIPYTSFVGAYSVYDLEKDFTGGCTNFQCINNTNDWQQMQECESAVYFCDNEEPEFFRICSYINCIRIYKSKILGKMTLIPYSFTRAIKAEGIERFYQHVADCLPSKLQHVKDEFLLANTQTELWEYKSRLFNALVSCMYGIHFFHGKINIHDFIYDFDTMVKSYSEEIAMEFMNLEYSDIETFLNMPWQQLKDFFCAPKSENKQLKAAYDERIRDIWTNAGLLDYLSENHGIDEKRAYLGKSRLKGISVDYMLDKVKNKTDIRKRAADLLNSWDSGTASSTYLLSEDKSTYASCIFAGEQSYRRILEKHPRIIRQIIYLSKHANLYPEVNGREELIEKYLDFVKIQLPLDSQEIQELADFAARNINQMQAWNIVDVIDCKVLPDNNKIGQLNLEFTKSFG